VLRQASHLTSDRQGYQDLPPSFVSRDVTPRRRSLEGGEDIVNELPIPLQNKAVVVKTRTMKPLPSKRNLRNSAESIRSSKEEQKIGYNPHLKEAVDVKRKKQEKEVNVVVVQEQKRQLKKFLHLTRQLHKGKDEKKVIELIKRAKATAEPLPLAELNELKNLEIMESPYSQSLHGMIKDIETVTIKRKVPEDTSMLRSSSQ